MSHHFNGEPVTLTSGNVRRIDFLPCWTPRKDEINGPLLLLANVPRMSPERVHTCQRFMYVSFLADRLPSAQYQRRQEISLMDIRTMPHGAITVDFFERFQFSGDLVEYNLTRLKECLRVLAIDCNAQHWSDTPDELRLQTSFAANEWSMALEFFLQIDGKCHTVSIAVLKSITHIRYSVDLFYFKTCSFRGACARRCIDPVTRREDIEGIFCIDAPVARYGMTQCGRPSNLCRCCRLQNTRAHDQRAMPTLITGVTFTSSYRHQFVNRYQVILNCPVVSNGSNRTP